METFNGHYLNITNASSAGVLREYSDLLDSGFEASFDLYLAGVLRGRMFLIVRSVCLMAFYLYYGFSRSSTFLFSDHI